MTEKFTHLGQSSQSLSSYEKSRRPALECEDSELGFATIGRHFCAIMHDLRNVLGAIELQCELLERDGVSESTLRSLKTIVDAKGRANELLRACLQNARTDFDSHQTLDLRDFMRGHEGLFRAVLGENRSLSLHIHGANSQFILGKSSGVFQLVMNLLANARDATPDGGVISIECETVILESPLNTITRELPPGVYNRLVVKDSGQGVAPQSIAEIFKPFFTTKGSEGTGLGLSIVRDVALDHQAGVLMQSALNQGTEFSVYFPATAPGRVKKEEIPLDEPLPSQLGAKLLVIEDDDSLRNAICKLLEAKGFQVDSHKDADSALAWLNQRRGEIDLIISDLGLPGMKLSEFVSEVKNRKPDTRFLFISGYSQKWIDQQRATSLTQEGLLEKPFAANQLLQSVAARLGRSSH